MVVINNVINEFIRQQKEHTEKELAEIITKYDFAVGSIELKKRLMEILPEGANIICSPYIESPTIIYAIKKFDVTDLLFDSKYNLTDKYTVLPKGHWIDTGSGQECSICHEIQYGHDSYRNYCSYCGAHMKEGD